MDRILNVSAGRSSSIVKRSLAGFVCLAAALTLSACDERDASSLRLDLKDDLSGTIVASGLVAPTQPAAVESGTAGGGVAWSGRAGVMVSRGSFKKLDELNVGGITFQTISAGSAATTGVLRPRLIKVTIPRGADVKWPALFSGANDEERAGAQRVLSTEADASPNTDLGTSVKITVNIPGKVISSGIALRSRGLSAEKDATTATLIMPVELAKQPGEPLVWHISWE
jgi:hypothetical protein